jgi:hypothetical protein
MWAEVRTSLGRARRRWRLSNGLPLAIVALGLTGLLAGCASGVAGGTTSASSHSASSAGSSDQPATPPQASGSSDGSTNKGAVNLGPTTYLIKSLQADLAVPDPRKTASDLIGWITTTDPHAQSAGVNYSRQDDGAYSVQMTYSVQASLYPQVQAYLANYTTSHDGRLVHLQESVQDVTSQYVDLQSQLTNLRTEQQRLLALMAHSTNLTDTIAIEDRLSQVEGQINQIEGRQNELTGQTSFYAVTIYLTPLAELTGQPPTNPSWNPGDVLKQAWGAATVFGEFLVSAAIWLGVFCIYAVPALLLGWIIARLVRRPRMRVMRMRAAN